SPTPSGPGGLVRFPPFRTGGGSTPSGKRTGAAPLRPDPGAAHASPVTATGRRRVSAAADHAPHHLRWLVSRGALPRASCSLHGLCQRQVLAVARLAHSVR